MRSTLLLTFVSRSVSFREEIVRIAKSDDVIMDPVDTVFPHTLGKEEWTFKHSP